MRVRVLGVAALGVTLAGCVAPEEPVAPAANRSAASAAPAPSSAKLEDAPVPNRKMGAPAGDSIIRIQK